ncbi:hypothetical protein [Actinoplanes sp. NPDC051859]|uniref:hypothetical protein n=1 Tax=Actinoplanes sp. NPDC051859 TaxID=3363909 RepID=UPI003793D6AF
MTPASSTRHALPLPAPWLTIHAADTTDQVTGNVRYQFRAARAAGTLVIASDLDSAEGAHSARIRIQLGDGHRR